MHLQGTKIVLRDKRITDAAEDYAWSTDEELSRLDATRPLSLSFQHALTLYEEELIYPPSRRVRSRRKMTPAAHTSSWGFGWP